jgi:hypothetical protein
MIRVCRVGIATKWKPLIQFAGGKTDFSFTALRPSMGLIQLLVRSVECALSHRRDVDNLRSYSIKVRDCGGTLSRPVTSSRRDA